MPGKYFKTAVADGVATLTLSHPPVNALSNAVFAELREAMTALKADPAVRVILLAAEGNVFIAGADVREILGVGSAAEGAAFCAKAQEVLYEIERSPIPVIAVIHGVCVGGGCELVMSCHLRIASDKARFGQPEINLGIIPGLGGTQRLTRLVGPAKAAELCLTGDMISAADAKAIGLVNLVVPETALPAQAAGLAKKIAGKSKTAVAQILALVREGLDLSLPDALALEGKRFGEQCMTADKKEGISAFLEKRQAKFTDK